VIFSEVFLSAGYIEKAHNNLVYGEHLNVIYSITDAGEIVKFSL
jgi:hypothetical protein